MPFVRPLATALAILALMTPALAGEIQPWSQQTFDAATAAGRPLVIHVTAPWCPTCRAQKPTVDALVSDPAYEDLLVLDVDFDTEKAVLRRFGVRQQSTFIAFRAGAEVDRSVGVTDPAAIAALFARTR